MPRFRRYLPPLLLLLPVILIRGKLMLTPTYRKRDLSVYIETGWPLAFRTANGGIEWKTQVLHEHQVYFSFPRLAADAAWLSLTVAVSAACILFWFRRSRSVVRFSLRSMLFAVTLITLSLGLWANYPAGWQHEDWLLAQKQ